MNLLYFSHSNEKKHNILILGTFIIIAILSAFLLMYNHALFHSADMPFHFKRINELILMLKGHQISPVYAFNDFKGSAVMFLYPYITVIPLAFVFMVIKSKITAFFVCFMILQLVSLIISFYSSLNFSKSVKVSYLFSCIYSLSVTFLGYNFISMDVGLSLSYIFLPLIFFGLFDLINGYTNWYKLTLGLSLVIFSHVLSSIIVIVFLSTLIISNMNKLNIQKCLNVLKAVITCIIITSIEWIHALLFLYNNHNINTPKLINLTGVSTKEFIKSSLGGLNTFGIGIFPIIGILLSLIFYKKFTSIEKQLCIISIIVVLFCSKLFPWESMPKFIINIMKYFQYTYRFFIIPILFMSYIVSVIIVKYLKTRYVFILSIIVAIVFQINGQINLINKTNPNPSLSRVTLNNPNFNESYKLNKSSQFKKVYDWNFVEDTDYYPKDSIPVKRFINNDHIISSNNHNIKLYKYGYNKFYFNNKYNNVKKMLLPIIYYDNEGNNIFIDGKQHNFYVNKNKLIVLKNIKSGGHVICIKPKTYINDINLLIDIFSLLGLIICVLKIYKYNIQKKI